MTLHQRTRLLNVVVYTQAAGQCRLSFALSTEAKSYCICDSLQIKVMPCIQLHFDWMWEVFRFR
jgi:hypothetical protein